MATPVVPACLAIAYLNYTLYGSPFESGYGPLGYLYQLGPRRSESPALLRVARGAAYAGYPARIRGAVRARCITNRGLDADLHRCAAGRLCAVLRLRRTGRSCAFCCRPFLSCSSSQASSRRSAIEQLPVASSDRVPDRDLRRRMSVVRVQGSEHWDVLERIEPTIGTRVVGEYIGRSAAAERGRHHCASKWQRPLVRQPANASMGLGGR